MVAEEMAVERRRAATGQTIGGCGHGGDNPGVRSIMERVVSMNGKILPRSCKENEPLLQVIKRTNLYEGNLKPSIHHVMRTIRAIGIHQGRVH